MRNLLIMVMLTAATLLIFWRVTGHDFIMFDDEVYVTQNEQVQDGLSRQGVVWAFSTTHANFWHPLTWLSHMLDCELFGLNPGGHHFTGLLIHLLNTLLLFLVLHRMTGALWPSAFVAALFAWHPLHVESVAWVSERKDVLSAFFWILTLGAYARYVEHPRVGSYLLVLVFFSLGLMAKPMLVTLPFVLLLLDYWPLGRFNLGPLSHESNRSTHLRTSAFHLVLEKIPFFALSAVACVLAYMAQARGGALKGASLFPIGVRTANAAISYVSYMEKMIWPHDLAVFYPHPGTWPMWQVAGAALLLLAVSALAVAAVRKAPYLAFGWFWYVGTLVPVIGLIQVGDHAMADRYTYVPLIGLFIMIAWGARDAAKRLPRKRLVLSLSALAVLCALAMGSVRQLKHWKNSVTLFQHTLNVTKNNYVAHTNLGILSAGQGRLDRAMSHYADALRIKPDLLEARMNMGAALATQNKFEQASLHYLKALQVKPDFAAAYYNLGNLSAAQGKTTEAVSYFQRALMIEPDDPEIHNNLGISLAALGKRQEAVQHFQEALRIDPDFTSARNNLNVILGKDAAPGVEK